jgi:hypothetical protein
VLYVLFEVKLARGGLTFVSNSFVHEHADSEDEDKVE